MLLAEHFVLPLEQYFLLLGVGLLAGLIHDAASQIVGFAYAFTGDIALYEHARERTYRKGDKRKGDNGEVSHGRSCDMLTRRKPR
jgi:hypothetical protein